MKYLNVLGWLVLFGFLVSTAYINWKPYFAGSCATECLSRSEEFVNVREVLIEYESVDFKIPKTCYCKIYYGCHYGDFPCNLDTSYYIALQRDTHEVEKREE